MATKLQEITFDSFRGFDDRLPSDKLPVGRARKAENCRFIFGGGLSERIGSEILHATTTGAILGDTDAEGTAIGQLVTKNARLTVVVGTGDGTGQKEYGVKIYEDFASSGSTTTYDATLKASDVTSRSRFTQFENSLFIALDQNLILEIKDDKTITSHFASDGSKLCKQVISIGNRLVYLGLFNNPNQWAWSEIGSPVNVPAVNLLTENAEIRGGFVIGDSLFISTDTDTIQYRLGKQSFVPNIIGRLSMASPASVDVLENTVAFVFDRAKRIYLVVYDGQQVTVDNISSPPEGRPSCENYLLEIEDTRVSSCSLVINPKQKLFRLLNFKRDQALERFLVYDFSAGIQQGEWIADSGDQIDVIAPGFDHRDATLLEPQTLGLDTERTIHTLYLLDTFGGEFANFGGTTKWATGWLNMGSMTQNKVVRYLTLLGSGQDTDLTINIYKDFNEEEPVISVTHNLQKGGLIWDVGLWDSGLWGPSSFAPVLYIAGMFAKYISFEIVHTNTQVKLDHVKAFAAFVRLGDKQTQEKTGE